MVRIKPKASDIKTWKAFPRLVKVVRKSHMDRGNIFFGHDFDHALRVSNYAGVIAEDPKTARLAGIAGICHNADRILQHAQNKGFYGKVSGKDVERLVRSWLKTEETITKTDKKVIIDAILKHSNKNNKKDSSTLIALMDADRLVNIEADLIIRVGQCMPQLRPVDPVQLLSDPSADFFHPGSVLRHIQEILDWEVEGGIVGLRLKKARKIAKSRFEFLKLFIKTTVEQRKESGLVPYPKIK